MFTAKTSKNRDRQLVAQKEREISWSKTGKVDGTNQATNLPGPVHHLQRYLGNSYMQSLGNAASIQRKCACGGIPDLDGECAECRQERFTLQHRIARQTISASSTSDQLPKDRQRFQNSSIAIQRQEEVETEDDELNQQSVVIFEDEEDAVQLQAAGPNEHVSLQRNEYHDNSNSSSVGEDIEQKILQSRGKGQPLNSDVRTSLESYFEQDFSSVRLHNDVRADYLARNLNAQAFTVGENVYFRRGYYDPVSQPGVRLITHEIAHVQQQRKGVKLSNRPPGGKLALGHPGDVYEREADHDAEEFIRARKEEAGAGPRIGQRHSAFARLEQDLSAANPEVAVQRQEQNAQRQGGPVETAAAAVAIAQAGAGVVRTIPYGDYQLTRPEFIEAVAPRNPECDPSFMPVHNYRWRFFEARESHLIFGYDFVNVHLVATWQTNGCDVKAFHVESPAGHRRSRLQRDTKAEIFARVSARLVPSTVVAPNPRTGAFETRTTGRPCCDYAAELMIPYEVTVDRPWPLSNYEVDGRLYIDGTGETRREQTERWT
jgi:hypothetical protein